MKTLEKPAQNYPIDASKQQTEYKWLADNKSVDLLLIVDFPLRIQIKYKTLVH